MEEKIIVNKEDLVAIADATRAATGSTDDYNVPELSVAAVAAITNGVSGSTNAVLYTEQSLTAEQKAQARANIGAVPTYRTINDQPLSANIVLSASDVNADIEGSADQALVDAKSYADTKIAELVNNAPETLDTLGGLATALQGNYAESIIGLSVDGQVITYIKGDGSQHAITTQDTDTTYSIGTDEATGLTKLYATTGSAEDGTMTQKAIKTELDKKVSVSIDSTRDMLIFTI